MKFAKGKDHGTDGPPVHDSRRIITMAKSIIAEDLDKLGIKPKYLQILKNLSIVSLFISHL